MLLLRIWLVSGYLRENQLLGGDSGPQKQVESRSQVTSDPQSGAESLVPARFPYDPNQVWRTMDTEGGGEITFEDIDHEADELWETC